MHARMFLLVAGLAWFVTIRRVRVTGDDPVDVVLTSYGARIASVHLTIASIGRGDVRPRRLILWLDDASMVRRPPRALRRLRRRGLEILHCEDLGPHKKYFPYVTERRAVHDLPVPFVTADDDVIYPRSWLDGLVSAYALRSEENHAYRAYWAELDGERLAPYRTWMLQSGGGEASFATFATGVSGVLYGPRMAEALRRAGDAFRERAPRADDVWLNAVAVGAGIRCRQVCASAQEFPTLPGTQQQNLTTENVTGGGNDVQIARTYGPIEVGRIRDDIVRRRISLAPGSAASVDGD